jgi:type I restriction enzyme S subunit
MSSEVRSTLLGDLLEITSSKRIHMADYVATGIPFYRSKEVIERARGNNISTELFISHAQFDLIKQKFGRPRDGDILLTSVGTLGVPYVVRGDGDFYFKDGNLTWMRNFSKAISPQFLYYWLTSPQIQQKLDEVSIGSTQKALTISALKALQISLPTRATQDGIVEVLGAISDRITLLRETNTTLEAIAQALFKSWFVDFDPVRAKMEGRAPEGIDEATAALFPDGFEESELGLVPRGWRVGTIDDLCDVITNGGTPSRSKSDFWTDGSIPWFKTGDFSDGFLLMPVERITKAAIAGSSAKVLPADAILMAIYAAPTVGRLGVLTESATFNQACTGMVAKKSVGPWFLFLTLFFGRVWFNSRANGAAQQNISKAIVASYEIVIPSPEVLTEFHQLAERLYRRIHSCSEQAKTLATLRDTLLPRLISGQLRLPEAASQAQAVMS